MVFSLSNRGLCTVSGQKGKGWTVSQFLEIPKCVQSLASFAFWTIGWIVIVRPGLLASLSANPIMELYIHVLALLIDHLDIARYRHQKSHANVQLITRR